MITNPGLTTDVSTASFKATLATNPLRADVSAATTFMGKRNDASGTQQPTSEPDVTVLAYSAEVSALEWPTDVSVTEYELHIEEQ